MLTNFKNSFKLLGGRSSQDSKSKPPLTTCASLMRGLMVVGLQAVLVQVSSEGKSKSSNVVIKSAMRRKIHHHHNHHPSVESCYLKTCYLCNKNLSLDKDIYMYRGDQGFCSTECRNRQIVLDEMRELEASTKNMRNSDNRHCSSASSRHETRLLLQDLRRRNELVAAHTHHQKHRAIFS